MDYLYTLSGFAVGAIVGLTGVGGGSLMTPLLVLLFGVHPATAVGTDLLYAALTKAGFKLEAESDLYRLADDPRTTNVFDPTIRGKTDQFALRFRKPG